MDKPISENSYIRVGLVLTILGAACWASYMAGAVKGQLVTLEKTVELQDRSLQSLSRDFSDFKNEVRDALRDLNRKLETKP